MNWNQMKIGYRSHLNPLFVFMAFLFLPFVLPYTALATEVLIFSMAAIGFDLLLGYTGILIFCQASFFAMGGYITALLIRSFDPNIFTVLFFAGSGAAIVGLFFGYMSTQRTGAYSALLTLAFNELIYFIAYQWKALTGGSDGLGNIPRPDLEIPSLLSVSLFSETRYYFFALFIVILLFLILLKITDSPFGRVLQGIRENEQRASAIGYNVRRYQTAAFVISSAYMGFAGSLFAMFNNFVDVSYAEFHTSAKILMIVLIGGMGTLYGSFFGAAIVVLTSDIANAYWERWPIVLGAMFIIFVLFARGGVLGMIRQLTLRDQNTYTFITMLSANQLLMRFRSSRRDED
jgi:branched-chain amino acid transport system permease protein